jgi:hypothetical protein
MTKRNKESSDQGSLFDYLHRVEELHRQSYVLCCLQGRAPFL